MPSAYAPIFIPLRCLSLSFCNLNCPYPASFPFLALRSILPGLLLYLIFHFLPAAQSRPASPLLLLLLRAIFLCSRCSARRKYNLFAPASFRPAPRPFPASLHPGCRHLPASAHPSRRHPPVLSSSSELLSLSTSVALQGRLLSPHRLSLRRLVAVAAPPRQAHLPKPSCPRPRLSPQPLQRLRLHVPVGLGHGGRPCRALYAVCA